MAEQQRDPRAYELMTVFIPDLSEEDNQSQIDKISGFISNAGGTLKETLTSSPWGRRRLAFTIRFNGIDYRDGFYTVYHFDAAPSAISAVERDLKLDTGTIRYLLVHDDPQAGERFPEINVEHSEEATETATDTEDGNVVTTTETASEAPVTPEASAEPAPTAAGSTEEPAVAEAEPAGTLSTSEEAASNERGATAEPTAESSTEAPASEGPDDTADDTATEKE